MELFTLGVLDAAGNPNYSQQDVEMIAAALSGLDDQRPTTRTRRTATSTSRNWYDGQKLVFGKWGNYNAADVINIVLGRPAHPAFIINKIWSEFIVPPPDAATLQIADHDVHEHRLPAQAAAERRSSPTRACSSRSTSPT